MKDHVENNMTCNVRAYRDIYGLELSNGCRGSLGASVLSQTTTKSAATVP